MKFKVRTTGSDVSSPDLASMLTSYVTGKYVVNIQNATKESVEFGLVGKSLLTTSEKKEAKKDDYFTTMVLTPTKKSTPIAVLLSPGESKSVEVDDANVFGLVAKFDKEWKVCAKESLDASKIATIEIEDKDLVVGEKNEDSASLLALLDLKAPVVVEQLPTVVRVKEKRCCC